MSHSSPDHPRQRIVLVRHGETEWSKSGQHTGRTDIPLTEEGRRRARLLGSYLSRYTFQMVLTSPLSRARETCELAGFGDVAQADPNLLEWDYGVYEGRTTMDIRATDPSWSVWLSPITNGETLEQVGERARQVVDLVANAAPNQDVALFAHGHILRVLAAVWVGLPPGAGRLLALDTATVSVLGYERKTRVIREWNLTTPGS
ncbi:phosphoglycerate mutase [Bryobacterales bacterium F-183]|nr:phosphoglycerate mutase [Bryobacterales bacterium F-183]